MPQKGNSRDYLQAKIDYVQGWVEDGRRVGEPTVADVAKRHGIPTSTLFKKSMEHDWPEERKLFRQRLENAKLTRSSQILASKGAEFDALTMKAAGKLLQLALNALNPKLTPNGAAALSTAIRNAQHVGRLTLGDSTENSKIDATVRPNLKDLTDAELETLEALLAKAEGRP